MYPVVLALHNLIRWVVVVTGVLAIGSAAWGVFRKQSWNKQHRLLSMFFTVSLDVQLLLGALLYLVYSPLTQIALQNFSAAMRESSLRFFSLEHALYMFGAVVFAHLGSISSRKAPEAIQKHRRALFWFLLAGALLALGMPWTRPWLPSF